MKWLLVIVLLFALFTFAPVARADGPTPAQYAMIHCSGLSIDYIVSGEQSFDTAFGFAHDLTTPEQWEGSYVDRTNQFAHAIGCGDVLTSDGQGAALTLAGKAFGPTFAAILTHGVLP